MESWGLHRDYIRIYIGCIYGCVVLLKPRIKCFEAPIGVVRFVARRLWTPSKKRIYLGPQAVPFLIYMGPKNALFRCLYPSGAGLPSAVLGNPNPKNWDPSKLHGPYFVELELPKSFDSLGFGMETLK